jgi:hypothetical protein
MYADYVDGSLDTFKAMDENDAALTFRTLVSATPFHLAQ